MKKIILYLSVILTVLVVLACSVKAQPPVPGYMGSRFSIQYQFKFNPLGFTRQGRNPWGTDISFGFRQAMNIEFIASRKIAIGLKYELFQSGLEVDRYLSGLDYDKRISRYHLTSHLPAFYLRVYPFRKFGGFAPIGPYWQFSLGMAIIQVNDFDSRFPHRNENGTTSSLSAILHAPVIGVGYGHNFVVARRLLLSLGVDSQLDLGIANEDYYSDIQAHWHLQGQIFFQPPCGNWGVVL